MLGTMSALISPFSEQAFLRWREGRPGRWELVGGEPVLAMAGAQQQHDQVTVNLLVALGSKLRGTRCRPWSADIAVAIPGGNVRQPDVTIDCAPVQPSALASTAPTVVFEVLSPSTRAFDQTRKLEEYKRGESLHHVVFLDVETPRAAHWLREGGAWSFEVLEGVGAILRLEAVPVALTLAEVYEDVVFTPPAHSTPA